MKKFYYILLVFAAAFLLASCETSTDPDPAGGSGSIFIQSTPAGAQIWVNGSNTNKVTPDSVTGLAEGNVNVTLKLTNYKDTTISVPVTDGFQTSRSVTLTTDLSFQTFGPVRIWETTGTGASQPSGLDLSAGVALSSSDADIDLFYFSSSSTFEIRTATGRTTRFLAGSTSNLLDGVSSPLAVPSWATSVADRDTTQYYFVFDADLHYSKLRIVSYGGGVIGNPAWVEVQWIYNSVANDQRFPSN